MQTLASANSGIPIGIVLREKQVYTRHKSLLKGREGATIHKRNKCNESAQFKKTKLLVTRTSKGSLSRINGNIGKKEEQNFDSVKPVFSPFAFDQACLKAT